MSSIIRNLWNKELLEYYRLINYLRSNSIINKLKIKMKAAQFKYHNIRFVATQQEHQVWLNQLEQSYIFNK